MDRERYERVRSLFHRAVDLDGSEQEAFLREACAGDDDLLNAVRSLLEVETRRLEEDGSTAGVQIFGLDGDPWPGLEQVGRYRLLRLLGRGGMGSVFLAEQDEPRRLVALKLVNPLVAHLGGRDRFAQEAQLLARISDPHIAHLYDAGSADTPGGRLPYIAMEYVEGTRLDLAVSEAQDSGSGGSFGERLRDHAALIATLARALHGAHTNGVVHRDVKPANVIVKADGTPVLLDLGIAMDTEDGAEAHTQTGAMPGTVPYMSPEQVRGERALVDRRTDVWALGVMLHELVCDRRPFDGPTIEAVRERILYGPVPDPRRVNRGVPRDLAVIVTTALERDLERRYQTAEALADDLDRWRERRPIQARPAGPLLRLGRWVQRNVAASLLIAALLGAGGWALLERAQALSYLEESRAQRAVAVFEAGGRARDAGDFRRAVTLFHEAEDLGYRPRLAPAFGRIESLYSLRRVPEARAELDALDAAAVDAGTPEHALLLLLRGALAPGRVEDPDAGTGDIRRASESGLLDDADSAYARACLAATLPEAQEALEEALRHDPAHILAAEQQVLVLLLRGEHSAALDVARRYRLTFPQAPSPRLLEAACLTLAGRAEESAERLRETRDLVRASDFGLLEKLVELSRLIGAVGKFAAGKKTSESVADVLEAVQVAHAGEIEVTEAADWLLPIPCAARWIVGFVDCMHPTRLLSGVKPDPDTLDELLAINREGFLLALREMVAKGLEAREELAFEASGRPGFIDVRPLALIRCFGAQKRLFDEREGQERDAVRARAVTTAKRLLEHADAFDATSWVFLCTWANGMELFEVADRLVHAARARFPGDAELMNRQAHLAYLQKRDAEAFGLCAGVLREHPDNPTAKAVLGFLRAQGRLEALRERLLPLLE